jgi:CTP:molybdopterin cytidylyltransferase MocA
MVVVGLVLAAGEGRRLGRPKALIEIDGERLVDRAARMLREGGCTAVTVVAGAVPLVVPGAHVVTNPDWARGMATSLRRGLAALPAAADGVVISLVDQPGIGSAAVARVVDALRAGAPAAVAVYAGTPRNPVGLSRDHWAGAAGSATGDTGARRYLAEHPDLATPVEVGDVADPADIDTAEDLDRLLRNDSDGSRTGPVAREERS